MKTERNMRRAPRPFLLVTLFLLGCHSSPELPPAGETTNWHAIEEETGSWRLRWSSSSWPLPFGEPCDLLVEVEPRGGGPAPQDVELRVDAGMPQHGHGILRRAEVKTTGPGRFRIEGLYLHMPGAWTVYLDVGHEGVFERSEIRLEVD
jgi:hypothetical protein